MLNRDRRKSETNFSGDEESIDGEVPFFLSMLIARCEVARQQKYSDEHASLVCCSSDSSGLHQNDSTNATFICWRAPISLAGYRKPEYWWRRQRNYHVGPIQLVGWFLGGGNPLLLNRKHLLRAIIFAITQPELATVRGAVVHVFTETTSFTRKVGAIHASPRLLCSKV